MFPSLKYIMSVIQFQKNSKLSRKELLTFQQKRWLKLLKHANKRSPYYSEVIKKINKPLAQVQPQDFPILTPELLQDNFDDIVTDPSIRRADVVEFTKTRRPSERYLDRYYVFQTSGTTTGRPLYFVATIEEVARSVAPSVARGASEKSTSKKRICMLGYETAFASSTQNMSICNNLWIAKKFVDYHLISMDQPLEEVLEKLNEIQPHVVSGYTKLLLLLADAQKMGKLKIKPESLEAGGEVVMSTDRKYLKDTFGCKVNNHYGSTEGASMGICRDGDDSIELFEDHLIFEIFPNETVITNLDSYTLPLIRYQMTDVLTPKLDDVPRPFRHIECGIGRSNGVAYFTSLENDKIKVMPLEFDPLMPEGVKTFSMISDKPNSVIYSIFIDSDYVNQVDSIKTKTYDALKEFFLAKGLANMEIKVKVASDYQLSPNSLKSQIWKNPETYPQLH